MINIPDMSIRPYGWADHIPDMSIRQLMVGQITLGDKGDKSTREKIKR